jgi:VIT1/CCC1 family predicted Fe2+/Mn2+ transporter
MRLPQVPAAPVIFGSADGLVAFLGVLAGLVVARQQAAAVWHAALGVGLAEMVGMTLGQYWSAKEDGLAAALACGLASAVACIAPAVPYSVARGGAALAASLLLTAGVAALICWLRPERGWAAVVHTYGLLVLAAVLCGASGLA